MKKKTIPLKRYKKYRKLRKLVEQWTRAEIMSRSPAIGFPDYGEYFRLKLDMEDKIRKHLWGTSNLIELGEQFGLPMTYRKRKKKKS